LIASWSLVVPGRADIPPAIFPAESRPTTSRLADARKLLSEKKWAEAVDELQAILDRSGSDLVTVSPRYSIPARRQCHLLIAALPPEELKAYRARMEPQARKWLDEGRSNRDVRLLRRVVDEAFCTRSGEAALDTLGDLAFERGDYDEAEFWWRHLAPGLGVNPDAIDRKTELLFPDPQAALPRIQAKQTLARIFGDPRRDHTDLLKEYRDTNGAAEGTLAGRKGKYADLLRDIARQAKTDTPTPAIWSTYGGDATRGLVLPSPPRFLDKLERLCRLGPTWRFALAPKPKGDDGPPAGQAVTPSVVSRSLPFHPLIVGDYAVIADARSVTAFDLRTGAPHVWFDVSEIAKSATFAKPDLRLPLPRELLDLRYTMTLADDCLYVRLGAQSICHADDVGKNDPERAAKEAARDESVASILACIDLKAGPKDSPLRWFALPVVQPGRPRDAQKGAIFEGAPMVHHGNLYIATTYFENDRTATAIACYPCDGGGQARSPSDRTSSTLSGLRWIQPVCETQELRGRDKRTRHHLVTAAGPYVIYCSHSGAIVALDALTGKPAWAVRYPSHSERENTLQPVLRDLSPPLYADSRLYVAPADYDHLLCLDPVTGQTIWDRDRVEATHLLGVGQGRLIFTTIHGLRAVGAADGSDSTGWQLPDGGGERAPAGRGLLIGDMVLWPTANGIVVCSQRDGTLDYRPTLGSQVPSGNLAYGNGCLAVADRTTLSVFVPDGMVIGERKKQARLRPEDPAAWLGLARAQADLGQIEGAQESLQKAPSLLRARDDRRLSDDIERETLDMLLTHAGRAADKQDWAAAAKIVSEATSADQSPQSRLAALVRAAEWWEVAGQPARAVAVWQDILVADELRGQPAVRFSRRQLTAAALAAERIDELKTKHGAQVYQVVERQFHDLCEKAVANRSAQELDHLVSRFPNADGLHPALLELAKLQDKAGHSGAAAQAWRRSIANRHEALIPALIGLARAYEEEKCWDAARSTWRRLERTCGGKVVMELDPNTTVREWVTAHLATLPDQAAGAEPTNLALPLARHWQIKLEADEHFLPIAEFDALLVTGRPSLFTARAPGTGKPLWHRRLSFSPQWAARHLDTVVAAGPQGAACLRQEDGGIIWEVAAPTLFAGRPPETMASFQLSNGRFFFVAGQGWLFALDAETGRVMWSHSAPGAGLGLPSPSGRFNPAIRALGNSVLVQPTPSRTTMLDAANGRLLRSLTFTAGSWWQRPLVRDDYAFCLAPNAHTIIQVGSTTGITQWEHSLTEATTLTGESPRLVGGKNAVLCLLPTNLGDQLLRLDPATGHHLWKQPVLLAGRSRPVEPAGWALDDEAVYFEQDGHLYARALADGKLLWDKALVGPKAPYRTVRLRDYLLTYPANTRSTRIQFRLLWGSVQWERSAGPDEGPDFGFPLLCSDPKTGQVIERMNLSSGQPHSGIHVRSATRFTMQPRIDIGPVATGEDQPVVQVSPRGVVVAVGDQLYSLKPSGK
jgi:outer membrane protein assembly factor BamB